MVIAASLSQLKGLLQEDALKIRPFLHGTVDRVLTGCRVVYVCLDEEVKSLAKKADNDNLKFKDHAKYLWKDDTFKELLLQIRSQQLVLSLLLQGLQMESIADVKKLVESNSGRLDQLATRSNTLRKSRPNIEVPESIFKECANWQDTIDAEAILGSPEFNFDDEIINAKAHRRAMALPDLHAGVQEPVTSQHTTHDTCNGGVPLAGVGLANLELKSEAEVEETHAELLGSLEHSLLPFMLPSSVSVAPSPWLPVMPNKTSAETISQQEEEAPPPLPPRRPTRSPVESKSPEVSINSVNSAFSGENIAVFSVPSSTISKTSTVSSRVTMGSSLSSPADSGDIQRETSTIARKTSYDTIFRALSDVPEEVRLVTSEVVEMHSIWKSLLIEERNFVERMAKIRTTFYDNVVEKWPVLENHLELIPIGEELAGFHRQYVFMILEGRLAQESFANCDPTLFETWASKTAKLYRDYCRRLPHAKSTILMTQNSDPKFLPYVETLDFGAGLSAKRWEDQLTLPVTQLDLYIKTLRRLHKICLASTTLVAKTNEPRFLRVLEVLRRMKNSCLRIIDEAQDREQIQDLHRRIHTLNADYLTQLNLMQQGRRILFQGMLARKKQGQGAWQSVHVVLLDNFLFWGMVKLPRSKNNRETKTKARTMQNRDLWILEAVSLLRKTLYVIPNANFLANSSAGDRNSSTRQRSPISEDNNS
jgi:hypothetical protein